MNSAGKEILQVDLGARSYPIHIGRDLELELLEMKEGLLDRGRKVVAVFDQGLMDANPRFCEKFRADVPVFRAPSGEETKSVQRLAELWDFLSAGKIDRSSSLFAFGGGVTGDLAGFAAASYLRGVSFYQVPTTLLAMVDSSVGGKTGINLSSGKNLVGAFHQPSAVYVDLGCLDSLPVREFSAGIAEIIKYGLLGNAELYRRLLDFSSPLCSSSPELNEIVRDCCADKARIVENDERETAEGTGGRALLNLGHTFAHAIEAVSGYGSYLHGEAVAVGLVCALRLSRLMGHCGEGDEAGLVNLLKAYELPDRLGDPLRVDDLLGVMRSDKKVLAGNLRFVLMENIGKSFVSSEVEISAVEEVWKSVGAE